MGNVRKYLAKVEDVKNTIDDLYTITFSTINRFKYFPGQFLHLALDEYDGIGQWPESRCFSMQSSPEDEFIKITFSVKGAFTSKMASCLTKGREVWLKLPFGDIFQRGHTFNNCVFIAGGTGITPFLSLFNSFEFRKYINPKIYLGFRSREQNLYTDELKRIQNDSVQIKYYYQSKDGIIDINKIYDECSNQSTYFISGPTVMIKSFRSFLIDAGLKYVQVNTDDWE